MVRKPVDDFHRRLGRMTGVERMWDVAQRSRIEEGHCGHLAPCGLSGYSDVRVPGTADQFNPELDKAGRVADLLELGEFSMCKDALLERNESCGGHFREEYQTPEGEASGRRRAVRLRLCMGVHRRSE